MDIAAILNDLDPQTGQALIALELLAPLWIWPGIEFSCLLFQPALARMSTLGVQWRAHLMARHRAPFRPRSR